MVLRITSIKGCLRTIIELSEKIKYLMKKTTYEIQSVNEILIEANSILQNSKRPDKIIKSARRKTEKNLNLIIHQIKQIRIQVETISTNNSDFYNLLPRKYKKYEIDEINEDLLNLVKSLNFVIKKFDEIKTNLKYEHFNFNNIMSEIIKIKTEDDFYLIEITLESLLKIIAEINNNKEDILKEIIKTSEYTLDATKEFQDFLDSKNLMSIIDADFISSLQNLKANIGGKTLKLSFPGRIVIPKKIIREVTYSPPGIIHPLSSRKLISYFSQQLGAEIIEVNITNKTEIILDLWKKYTYQGRKASQSDEQKFINSGDMSILFLCCKLNPQPLVIFSNNKSEIEKVGQILKDKNMAYIIRVVNFEEIYSKAIN